MYLVLEDATLDPTLSDAEGGRLGRLVADYLGRLVAERDQAWLLDVTTALEVLAAYHFDPEDGEAPVTCAAAFEKLSAGPLVRTINFHNTARAHAAGIEHQLMAAGERFGAVDEDDLDRLLSGGAWHGRKPPLIPVFYEGYRNNYDVALTLLERAGLRGWFFIPTSFIDTPVPDQHAFARAHQLMVEAWRSGGRWIYIGAGTSGRIAALDAAECQPTFGVPPDRVVALIAGGEAALTRSVEGAEDDRSAAVKDLEDSGLDPGDVVVGLAASGRTPYVVAAIGHASELGCPTIGISNNPGSELGAAADVCIELITGAEVLTGSTRLKAGTSEKLVLNMLSTAAFTRLDKVYENLMVDLQAGNEKLRGRSRRIVREASGVTEDEAGELLRLSDGSVKVAVVMGKVRVRAEAARELLTAAGGNLRRALDAAGATKAT
jgi:N-acetylmuramic acid 6-phosphate etherase